MGFQNHSLRILSWSFQKSLLGDNYLLLTITPRGQLWASKITLGVQLKASEITIKRTYYGLLKSLLEDNYELLKSQFKNTNMGF